MYDHTDKIELKLLIDGYDYMFYVKNNKTFGYIDKEFSNGVRAKLNHWHIPNTHRIIKYFIRHRRIPSFFKKMLSTKYKGYGYVCVNVVSLGNGINVESYNMVAKYLNDGGYLNKYTNLPFQILSSNALKDDIEDCIIGHHINN
jgi:hypothetical protein